MINRHSNEQSEVGEGVEVILNEPCFDEQHGNGQLTEKKIHLNKYALCSWLCKSAFALLPTMCLLCSKLCYVTCLSCIGVNVWVFLFVVSSIKFFFAVGYQTGPNHFFQASTLMKEHGTSTPTQSQVFTTAHIYLI